MAALSVSGEGRRKQHSRAVHLIGHAAGRSDGHDGEGEAACDSSASKASETKGVPEVKAAALLLSQ